MRFEEYRDQLDDLSRRARRAVKPDDFLGVYDGVKDVVESGGFRELDSFDKVPLYKHALDIYGLVIKALHTDLTQAKADISTRDESVGRLIRGNGFQ